MQVKTAAKNFTSKTIKMNDAESIKKISTIDISKILDKG
jgi:hypothetical protein